VTHRIHATVDPTGCRLDAVTPKGHSISTDTEPPEGRDTAASPKETLLAALAGCTAADVTSILRKKRQTATSYEIEVTAEAAPEPPTVFTTITVEHRVAGDVEPEALRRSIELSVTKYCPVNAMLATSVSIEHRYRLVGRDGAEHAAVVAMVGPDGAHVV